MSLDSSFFGGQEPRSAFLDDLFYLGRYTNKMISTEEFQGQNPKHNKHRNPPNKLHIWALSTEESLDHKAQPWLRGTRHWKASCLTGEGGGGVRLCAGQNPPWTRRLPSLATPHRRWNDGQGGPHVISTIQQYVEFRSRQTSGLRAHFWEKAVLAGLWQPLPLLPSSENSDSSH